MEEFAGGVVADGGEGRGAVVVVAGPGGVALGFGGGVRAERDEMRAIGDIVGKLLASKPVYRCSRCGFGAKGHHWQCPSCKSWHAVKPIHGIAGD